MFSDPTSVTYNSVSKNLNRLSSLTGVGANFYGTKYATADGELTLKVAHSQKVNADRRVEVLLTRTAIATTPITGEPAMVSNSFGIILELDEFGQAAGDVALLRTALLALVDTTFTGRLVSGEA